jgi:hypothetical protein
VDWLAYDTVHCVAQHMLMGALRRSIQEDMVIAIVTRYGEGLGEHL